MSIEFLVMLLVIESAVTGLLTQAVKMFYQNAGKECAANVVALIDAVVVGGVLTSCIYVILGVPFGLKTIIYIAGYVVVVWIGAMIGFDKVVQMIKQITAIRE